MAEHPSSSYVEVEKINQLQQPDQRITDHYHECHRPLHCQTQGEISDLKTFPQYSLKYLNSCMDFFPACQHRLKLFASDWHTDSLCLNGQRLRACMQAEKGHSEHLL